MILQIIRISARPNVTIGPHRFGGIEFRLGKREMRHLQGPVDKAPFEILVLSASIPTQQIDHYRIVARYQ